MIEYLQHIKRIVDTLSTINSQLDDEDIVLCVLNGLLAAYHPFKTAIRTHSALVTMSELTDLLLIEEQQLPQASSDGSSTLAIGMSPVFTVIQEISSSNGTRRAHTVCGKGKAKFRKSNLYCQICDKPGHSAANCYHRLNINYQKPVYNQRPPQQHNPIAPQFANHPAAYFATPPISLHSFVPTHNTAYGTHTFGQAPLVT